MDNIENQPSRDIQHSEYVGDFVFGGIDGVVTTFAVVAGVAGANLMPAIILVLGLANLLADGFAMGVGNYLSIKSQGELKHLEASRSPIVGGVVTFLAFIVIGLVPLFAFVLEIFAPHLITRTFLVSIILTAIALFIIGATKRLVIKESIWKAGIETLIMGGLAAAVAYGVGYLLQGLVTA